MYHALKLLTPNSTASSERLSSAEPAGTREGSEAFSASELKHRKDMEYEEDDNQEANVQEVKHAILSIPNIPLPRGSDGKVVQEYIMTERSIDCVLCRHGS